MSFRFRGRLALEVMKNLVMQVPAIRSLRVRMAPRTAVTAGEIGAADLDRYVFALLRKVRQATEALTDKHIAEIGPGDHIATGFAMLAAGAASYTCLDRFIGPYSSVQAKAWYRAVQTAWPTLFPQSPWPAWLDADRFPEGYPDQVRVVHDGVEGATALPICDVVCSYAVGEHVLDVGAFGRTTRQLLAPDGIAMHLVDFSQHFDWSQFGDRYLFLSLSDRTWRWMGSARGLENRVRYQEFVDELEAQGLVVRTIAKTMAPDEPDPARLLPRFRSMPMESLRTLEATFVCKREQRPDF